MRHGKNSLRENFFCVPSMRDLVPRKSPVKKNTVTPWSTYCHSTPIRLPRTKRPSLSPSPVAHSKSPMPVSPRGHLSPPHSESASETPSFTEYPHESMQLPRRTAMIGKLRKQRPPVEVFEDFIKDLPMEAKEKVRASYNGPDWPCRRPSLISHDQGRKSAAALSSVSTLIPQQYTYQQPMNRFLVGLPLYCPPAPQVVYHYFPRGC